MSVFTTKVALICKRAFLILSLLGFICQNTYAFWQETALKKTKYEFTDTRISEADTLLKKRQYQAALEAYQKAYATYEAESFYEGMVYAKERMGRTYRSLRQDSLSRVTFQKAASLSREHLGPNHMLESKAYLNNGIRAHFMEKPVEASQLLDSANWVYEKTTRYDSAVYREIVNFKYYAYYYSNLSRDTLIKYLNERGRIYELEGSTLEQNVFFLSDYCRAYFRIGDFQKSTAYGLEAVRVSENALELLQPYYYRDALFNLARSLWSERRYDQALDVIDKLISYTVEKSPESEDLFGYYNLKALILSDKKDYSASAKQFHELLDLLSSRKSNNASFRQATVRDATMNLGVCYQLMGDYDKAKYYLTEALAQEKRANELFDTPFSIRYRYLGQYYGVLKDHDNAFMYYDSALRNSVLDYKTGLLDYPTSRSFNVTFENLSILKEKQINMEKLFQANYPDSVEILKASVEYAKNTHNYLVQNREELQVSQGRLFLSQSFKSLYESAINSVYILDSIEGGKIYIDLASKFFSLSKSILFLEQSGELGEIQDSRLSLSVKNEYYQIKTDIERLESGFYDLISQVNTSDSLRIINEELLKLDGRLRSFRDSIKDVFKNDEIYGAIESNDLSNVSSFLEGREGHLLIDFFVGDRFTFVLGQSKEKRVLKRLSLDSTFTNSFRQVISTISERPAINDYENSLLLYQDAAYHLYTLLLKPVLDSFEEPINDLTIIPDDLLTKIPFDALVSEKSDRIRSFSQLRYLLLTHNINYALSAKSIVGAPKNKTASRSIFGIGYSGTSNNLGATRSLGDLPGTEEEIEFLRQNVKGDFFLGEEGTKELFMDQARNYDVLHLAVHGKSDSSNRYESRLIFSNQDVLKTADLYMADLKARLVVLSACESGVGEFSKGEGVFSIARGFALVGVPSVVMSLWSVNDRVSSDLMVAFHKNLAEDLTVSGALTKTKRQYLSDADEFTSHPYYWSAFVSLGEDLNIDETGREKTYLVALSALLVFGLVFYIRRRRQKEKGS